MGRPAEPGERVTPGVGDFAALVMRRKLVWMPIFGVVLAIAIHSYVTSPVFFRAQTRVMVSRGERESSLNPRVRILQWEEELSSEVETIFSQPVITLAERALLESGIRDLTGAPIGISPGQVSAAPLRGSNVIEITYQNRDPDLSREGVAAITEAYMDYRRATRSAPEMDHYFRSQIEAVRATLDELQNERKTLLQQAGLASLPEQRVEIVNLLGTVRTSLVRIREQVAYAKARLNGLRNFRASGLANVEYIPVFAGDEAAADGGVRRLVEAMVDLQARENEMASRYTDAYPPLTEIRNQIEGHRVLIEEAADRYENVLKALVSTWLAREEQLNDELQALEWELSDYPDREARLSQLDLQISTLEGNYRRLVSEYQAAGIQNASSPSWTVRLYASPSAPIRVHTGDLIRTLVIPGFALVISLGLAFVIDALDPSIKSVADAERIFGAPVLASVVRVGRK